MVVSVVRVVGNAYAWDITVGVGGGARDDHTVLHNNTTHTVIRSIYSE